LLFDIRQPDTEDESAIAEQRVAPLYHVPLLLGIAHLLCAVAVAVQAQGHFSLISATTLFGSIALALACDLAGYTILRLRDRLELSPRTITLTICALVGATGMMWSFFGYTASTLPGMSDGALLPLLIGTGVTAGAVVSISSRRWQ
jgi:hypothetical protein